MEVDADYDVESVADGSTLKDDGVTPGLEGKGSPGPVSEAESYSNTCQVVAG